MSRRPPRPGQARKGSGKVRTITASEIGEYAYCSRAWWYSHVVKLAPDEAIQGARFDIGRRAHARHGRAVLMAGLLRTAGLWLAALGVLALLVALALLLTARP